MLVLRFVQHSVYFICILDDLKHNFNHDQLVIEYKQESDFFFQQNLNLWFLILDKTNSFVKHRLLCKLNFKKNSVPCISLLKKN